jgi:ABC-type branched-subunit amino acid transport system ATPase component
LFRGDVVSIGTNQPKTDRNAVRSPEGPEPSELLAIEDVTVRFGGVVANDRVSLTCRQGEITALLGPNGAGKSTLFDVVTGARRPMSGRVMFKGVDVTGLSAHGRARLGMARTFQNLSLARELSVFDNVLLGVARFRNYGPVSALLALPRVRRNDRMLRDLTLRALEVVGLTEVAEMRTGDLPFGDLHRVEIARAIAMAPTLLMLDEPSAGMDRAETLQLADALIRIRDRWGISILVVEHDLEFVRLVAERAFVLDFGQLIAGGSIEEVFNDAKVRAAYLGVEADNA